MWAPASPSVLAEFQSTNHLHSTILVSIWELGGIIDPLVIGLLSEIFGRLPVYHIANILFIMFSAIAEGQRALTRL